ncbi:uncharacterized protein EV420DRAFT_1209336 [Desarmillaria tabescens]|uniref:Secreted protein n=1 Tax=Armillaria tabescens TaxID=1929756 RepID=A0AA39J996_ARMTA|nr:uncharacterized protein EV420DRAFT_1209336 [Desarmillaria tabescens]KAK0438505.1 hypothetical protein EV420DRAFT_1209336 [Desarmillaria tabescens]
MQCYSFLSTIALFLIQPVGGNDPPSNPTPSLFPQGKSAPKIGPPLRRMQLRARSSISFSSAFLEVESVREVKPAIPTLKAIV